MAPSNTSSTNAVTGSASRYVNANDTTSNSTHINSKGDKKAEAKALAVARTQSFLNSTPHCIYLSKKDYRSIDASRECIAANLQQFNNAFYNNTTCTT
ncbi:hypothetical protein BGZ60DRAFT_521980 [Tricladium varicosporioides]|nr:hypothetical protein BGZ60DRAFT_521980 [Hymenoscyphus varicosporioides]